MRAEQTRAGPSATATIVVRDDGSACELGHARVTFLDVAGRPLPYDFHPFASPNPDFVLPSGGQARLDLLFYPTASACDVAAPTSISVALALGHKLTFSASTPGVTGLSVAPCSTDVMVDGWYAPQ